jgi:hypothetical protein
MPFSKEIVQKLSEILKNQTFSEDHTVVQKTCYKKDSLDLSIDVGDVGLQKIENFEYLIETPDLAAIEFAQINLKSSVMKEVLVTRNNVLESLQTAASTASEEQKIEILSELNKSNSLIRSIHNSIQAEAIPMIFAVFSRKNDYYGLGGMGV